MSKCKSNFLLKILTSAQLTAMIVANMRAVWTRKVLSTVNAMMATMGMVESVKVK